MVPLRHIAIVAAACAVGSLPVLADDQNRQTRKTKIHVTRRRFVPRLNDIMVATQLRHFKLWYAGTVQNRPLANYELTQIRDAIVDTERLYTDKGGSKMSTMMTPATDDLADAIKTKRRKEVRQRLR
jgi:hypothetical protein